MVLITSCGPAGCGNARRKASITPSGFLRSTVLLKSNENMNR